MTDLPTPAQNPTTFPIGPFDRTVAAFDIGLLIGELRWHVQLATLTASRQHEQFARECAEEIGPRLSSLFPDHRGGEARRIVQEFRDTWDTLDTEAYVVDFSELFHEFGRSLDIVDVVNGLRPFIETVGDDLHSAVVLALKDESQLLRTFQLGLCISEGFFPKAKGEEFFEVVDDSEYGPWPLRTGFKASTSHNNRQFSRTLEAKRLNPGDLVPDRTWPDEVARLLDSVGIIEPVPQALGISNQVSTSHSDTVQALIDWVRVCLAQRVQRDVSSDFDPPSGASSSLNRASNAPTEQAPDNETSDADWIHDAGDNPPIEFSAGPLVGTQARLGFAIRLPSKPPPKQEKSYRDDLKRAATARNSPAIWVRRAITVDQLEAFFRDPVAFKSAYARWKSFEASRPQGSKYPTIVVDSPR